MRLHAPRHAGRTLAYCVPGGEPGRVTFDAAGHADAEDEVGSHLMACGGGLIRLVDIPPAASMAESSGDVEDEAHGTTEADASIAETQGRRRGRPRKQSL